jgi:3-hydroxyacyl-[acyl-carrier-protein] dehydratase
MGFTFVDRIIDMDPGHYIHAQKFVLENEEIFEVHYPGFPVIPGTFLTEMMAQTSGKCLDAEKKARGMAMLARIKSANFRQYVGPSKMLDIKGEIVNNRDMFATALCKIEMGEEKVCTAELLFSFVAMDELDPQFRDKVLEAYLSKTG